MELPGCHTQAKTMDQLLERTKEAIQAYISCCIIKGEDCEANPQSSA